MSLIELDPFQLYGKTGTFSSGFWTPPTCIPTTPEPSTTTPTPPTTFWEEGELDRSMNKLSPPKKWKLLNQGMEWELWAQGDDRRSEAAVRTNRWHHSNQSDHLNWSTDQSQGRRFMRRSKRAPSTASSPTWRGNKSWREGISERLSLFPNSNDSIWLLFSGGATSA